MYLQTRSLTPTLAITSILLLLSAAPAYAVPPSWEILPIPRYVDYGSADDFLVLGKVGVVRKSASPYQTIRDAKAELVGQSTVTEEELSGVLKDAGVTTVKSLSDDSSSYSEYDTLILLGSPTHNRQTAKVFEALNLSFDRWDDPRTPEDDFTDWKDFGFEGYLLKVTRIGPQNIVILAGYDRDDETGKFHGAGTFYALQSFRQLLVTEDKKESRRVRVKQAEIADSPLVAFRGVFAGYFPSEELERRTVDLMARSKLNYNVWWYGNQLVAYSSESSSKFRYPWKPKQLELIQDIAKRCRERFITMVFCMNPDHYNVEWVAPRTFDGSKKDPIHYDPEHRIEPEFKEMWAKLGREVNSDIDILVAKYGQLQEVAPGSMFQMMNEDDIFGLVHEADKKLFQTDTGDAKQDAINYGKARAQFLARFHRRVMSRYPENSGLIPLCPPGNVAYQLDLETNAYHCRDFLTSMVNSLEGFGLKEKMPILTTGGGTCPVVTTNKNIDDFKSWCEGGPVLLSYNYFADFSVGAYETDPQGAHTYQQRNTEYPAGYRDKELYKRVWGMVWNGPNAQQVLTWAQSQFLWNMLALDREKVNALSTRKVSTAASYPLVKSFYEEFDNPVCQSPDNQPPTRFFHVSDEVAFPNKEGYTYDIRYTGRMRKACQRLREKLQRLTPELEKKWEFEFDKEASLHLLGYRAASFCSVYLAYGYVLGWEDDDGENKLEGAALRDLFLEADRYQETFFAGPDEFLYGFLSRNTHYYRSAQRYLYTKGQFKGPPASPEKADFYIDLWKDGLQGKFFEPVFSAALPEVGDDAAGDTSEPQPVRVSSTAARLQNCILFGVDRGGASGSDLISSDPLLQVAANGDLTLASSSPAIKAGIGALDAGAGERYKTPRVRTNVTVAQAGGADETTLKAAFQKVIAGGKDATITVLDSGEYVENSVTGGGWSGFTITLVARQGLAAGGKKPTLVAGISGRNEQIFELLRPGQSLVVRGFRIENRSAREMPSSGDGGYVATANQNGGAADIVFQDCLFVGGGRYGYFAVNESGRRNGNGEDTTFKFERCRAFIDGDNFAGQPWLKVIEVSKVDIDVDHCTFALNPNAPKYPMSSFFHGQAGCNKDGRVEIKNTILCVLPAAPPSPAESVDKGPSDSGGWRLRVADEEVFEPLRKMALSAQARYLVRARIGREKMTGGRDSNLSHPASVTLAAGTAVHADEVCYPRWVNWLTPAGADVADLAFNADVAVRVYEVQVHRVR